MVKKAYLILAALLIFVPIISASLNVDINVNPSFKFGDTIKFGYIISSDMNEELVYAEEVSCPEAPRLLLFPKTANVGPGLQIQGDYTYSEVTPKMEPQTCTANIRILSPTEEKFEKEFLIDTAPSISFKSLLCKDSSCETESKIFMQNEDIYFSYVSDAYNPTVIASLIYPDGTTKQIDIPTSIKAEQIGAYTLEVTASKEGYKSVTTTEQFGVIEKPAEIKTLGPLITEVNKPICNNNGVCSGFENAQNCPSDCRVIQERPEERQGISDKERNFYIFIGIIGLIIVILIIALVVINTKKK